MRRMQLSIEALAPALTLAPVLALALTLTLTLPLTLTLALTPKPNPNPYPNPEPDPDPDQVHQSAGLQPTEAGIALRWNYKGFGFIQPCYGGGPGGIGDLFCHCSDILDGA